jgi:hypothetical protein
MGRLFFVRRNLSTICAYLIPYNNAYLPDLSDPAAQYFLLCAAELVGYDLVVA